MDKKTEAFIKKLADKNKKLSQDDINDNIIKKNAFENKAKQERKELEELTERTKFFNDMKRRDF